MRTKLANSIAGAGRRTAVVAAKATDVFKGVVQLLRQFAGAVARRLDTPALIALATLVVVLVQLDLMRHQTKLMQRQSEIIEGQLARVPSLEMFERVERRQGGSAQILFSVRNDGTKTARDFYLHVALPAQLASFAARPFYIPGGVSISEEPVEHGGQTYTLIRGFAALPVYPTRELDLFALTVHERTARGTYPVRWKVVAEDGLFPPALDEWGKLVVSIGEAKP